MSILINRKQYTEIMDLINRVSRDNSVLLSSMDEELTNDEKYLYKYIKNKNRKYFKLLKALDKSKSNNVLKDVIAKWLECEITGDDAMSKVVKILNFEISK
ncbi:UNVERIFIED_ORG: hypothetical protein B2H98_18210 [Clostridium botulinum]